MVNEQALTGGYTMSTKPQSLKQMAEDKGNDAVSKKTIYQADPRILKVEPGFNLRIQTPALQESINALKEMYIAGAVFPPIDVHKGTQIIDDGHRRHAAIMLAIAEGHEVRKVDVREVDGNNADRVVHMLGSGDGSRPLSTLEKGLGYKRLLHFGWSKQDICARRHVSITHVEQALTLANANTDVQNLLALERVSVGAALDAIREHGDDAGKLLQELSDSARGVGDDTSDGQPKKVTRRVTNAARNPESARRLPAKFANRYAKNVGEMISAMPDELRGKVALASDDETIPVSARYLKELMELHAEAEKIRGPEAGAEGDPRQQSLLSDGESSDSEDDEQS
ncbi:ParB/RepB/Spo0J family partition protein [Ralstonia sp. OTU4908]|jgi:ParB family chromosome partitioning protein|uniref:ParB/RepB/Spo0J family partition protein n=1 Tax=Ralstonia sp. OTU4908 TaxID=3043851 RepID=UPI00313CFAFF